MKKTIAIIGATGGMGSAIAQSLAALPVRLLLMSENPNELNALSSSIHDIYADADIDTLNCPVQCSWEADMIILALPYPIDMKLAMEIRPFATQKVVLSISRPNDDGLLPFLGTSSAEELQSLLVYSKVVKAFSTLLPDDILSASKSAQTVDCLLASNHDDALDEVAELVRAMGLDAVVCGGLAESRLLEIK